MARRRRVPKAATRFSSPSKNHAVPVASFPNLPNIPLATMIHRAKIAQHPAKNGSISDTTWFLVLFSIINSRTASQSQSH